MSAETIAMFDARIEQLLLLINEEHQDFLYIAESLQKIIISEDVSYTKVAQIFLQACTALRAHYADEETVMKDVYFSTNHPLEYEAHIEQHREVLHTLDEFSNRFLLATNETYLSLAQEIVCYFNALQLHMDDQDKKLLSLCFDE